VPALATSLAWLASEHGTRVLVADAHGDQTIHEADFSGAICIAVGNEDAGVSAAVRAIVPRLVRIPMHKRTDSLNVASASAVMLFEARRQR
jgi:tRNA G18 (ribose-2'-O)-methylase SpoU